MSEYVKNDRKMNYLKQTFKNMLNYLSKQELDIYIRVHSFNVQIDVDIENIKITKENVSELCSKIMNIEPESSTNIELALETARNTLNEYSEANPKHEIAHIFMTDGNPTIGQQNNDILSEIVDNRFNNIFIGYGLDHNAILMKKLSEHRNADYQFVDDMENTGLVYGESVHQLLYPALKDVEIHADDGVIYDWETNEWKDVIFVNVLVSETEKLYQVKKNKIDNMEIDIYGKTLEDSELELLETVNQIPDLINIDTNHIDEVDLTKYMYRQKVQELLYIANKQNNNDSLNGLKTILKDVFKKMRTYMRDNNMLDDPFMKLLCDDISITYQNIGKLSGLSFTYNRQTSQGRQRAYNVRSTSNDDINLSRSKYHRYPQNNTPPLLLKRQFARSITNDFGTMDEFDDNTEIIDFPTLLDEIINEGDEDEDDLDNYLVSNDITSCYSTPSVLNTMRSFSQNL
jgi:hypothetical protein